MPSPDRSPARGPDAVGAAPDGPDAALLRATLVRIGAKVRSDPCIGQPGHHDARGAIQAAIRADQGGQDGWRNWHGDSSWRPDGQLTIVAAILRAAAPDMLSRRDGPLGDGAVMRGLWIAATASFAGNGFDATTSARVRRADPTMEQAAACLAGIGDDAPPQDAVTLVQHSDSPARALVTATLVARLPTIQDMLAVWWLARGNAPSVEQAFGRRFAALTGSGEPPEWLAKPQGRPPDPAWMSPASTRGEQVEEAVVRIAAAGGPWAKAADARIAAALGHRSFAVRRRMASKLDAGAFTRHMERFLGAAMSPMPDRDAHHVLAPHVDRIRADPAMIERLAPMLVGLWLNADKGTESSRSTAGRILGMDGMPGNWRFPTVLAKKPAIAARILSDLLARHPGTRPVVESMAADRAAAGHLDLLAMLSSMPADGSPLAGRSTEP